MILFTSDLDRTMIYSDRMMKACPSGSEAICVEMIDDRMITFMSENSIRLLKEFSKSHLFVPVTTRALYQYERIEFFQKELQPQYAITSNGGTILANGQVDQSWTTYIQSQILDTAIASEDMLKLFQEIRHESWVLREFSVDQLFYMFHVDIEAIPQSEFASFEQKLLELGWRSFLHGKKLYMLPIVLDKANAVARVKELVDYDIHIAAGDSFMDYNMIKEAQIGYSPLHGELFERWPDAPEVTWLNNKGAASTEELLRNLQRLNTTLIR